MTGAVGKILLIAMLSGLPLLAEGEPVTPGITLNKAYGQARLADQQRCIVEYDVRSVGGAGILLFIWGPKDPPEQPRRVWRFDKPHDSRQLSMNDLPLSLYALRCVAIDREGKPVALPSPFIALEYGGWKAWRDVQPDTAAQPGTFADAGRLTPENMEDRPEVVVLPGANVCGYGKSIVLTAAIKNLPSDEQVHWEVDGEGSLKVINQGQAVFTAPGDMVGQSLSRVIARSRRYPDVYGTASVLITDVKEGDNPGVR